MNNKSGILEQPREHDTTVFKLCVFYHKKENGEFWSAIEKGQNKNRKYHDSIDFILTPGGYVTRHDIALNKLFQHLEKWGHHIDRALLFYNDFANEKQYKIGTFSADQNTNKFVQPLFNLKESIKYNEKVFYNNETGQPTNIIEREIKTQNVFCTGLLKAPLAEYSLKHNKTTVFYRENNIKTRKIM